MVTGIFAQGNYAVRVSPTLTPPYSLKLSDYCKFGSQQFVVNIMVNDLNVSNLPVKLHIKLETIGVTIETPLNIITTPIYIDGGAATVIFGDDLKDYFNINNLIFKGYSKEAYKRSGQLPEGFYKFTVEVLHFQTNRLLSSQGTATAWIALGKPPVLTFPENGKEMGEFKGMPITFSWLASNVGNPLSIGSTQYKFEMWEMRVEGVNPYTVSSTVPVFHEELTQNTLLNLYPSTLLMEPGMKYAWRVTASDMNGYVPFEQDGHSEIRCFTYKSKCDSVRNLLTHLNGRTGSFNWESDKNHTSYNINIRNPSTGWLSASETFDNKAEFFNLDYGTNYELRVQAVCNGDPNSVSDFSEWKKLIIPPKRQNADTSSCPGCKCDDNLGSGKLENLTLKNDLKLGDTIKNSTGTTRFIIKSVESQGNGVFKGTFLFWAEIWKLKFICKYWDLSVNTDNVIVKMDYESLYNPQYLLNVDSTKAYIDKLAGAVNELTVNTTIKDSIDVNETISSIYVNAGDSLIAVTVGSDGQLHEVVIQPNTTNVEQTMVKGKNGEKYVVTSDGEIMGMKEYKNAGGGNKRKMDEYIKENESKHLSSTTEVNFSASPKQKYGFDAYTTEKAALITQYPTLQNGYRSSFKSIAAYSPDNVIASASGNGITFRDEMGIPAIVSGTELTVRGSYDGEVTSLYAYKSVNDSTEEIAGKLNLMSFDEQIKKLYIISVNNSKIPDPTALQNVLNQIYSQAVTHWEVVKIDKNIEVDFPDGKMTHGGSGLLSVYNTDQKSIINKFTESYELEKGAMYLFYIDNVQGKTGDIAGYMPLQNQVGFMYENPDMYVVAHELGHGAFNLRHTFSADNFISSEGTTKNLLDYKGGTELWKHQWGLVHDPKNILFAWAQSEGEGEWTTDGHYYTVQLVALLMNFSQSIALKLGKAAEDPDTHVFSDIKMQEKDTWLIPKLQQRYHALTGGYHGVEMAITAYALLKTHRDEVSFNYLIHRFGDCFAHFDVNSDKKGINTIVKLKDYIDAIDNYIDKKFEFVSAYSTSNLSFDKLLTTNLNTKYIVNETGKIITTNNRATVATELIDFLLISDHNTLGVNLTQSYMGVSLENHLNEILNYLPKAVQNDNIMYGAADQIKCFTFGHLMQSKAKNFPGFISVFWDNKTNPDNIMERTKLYLYYLDKLEELLSLRYNILLTSDLTNNIKSIFTDIIEQVKYTSVERLDGILNFEIAKIIHQKEKEFTFSIPIKFVEINELSTQGLLVNSLTASFDDDANKIKEDTYKYFEKSNTYQIYYIESKLKMKDNIKYIEFKLIKK